jgi:hypothetical protein
MQKALKSPEAIIHDFEETRAKRARERRRAIVGRVRLLFAFAAIVAVWCHFYPQHAAEGINVFVVLGICLWRLLVLEENVRKLENRLDEIQPRSDASKAVIDT